MAPQAGHGDGTGSTPRPDPIPPLPGGASGIPEAGPADAVGPSGFGLGGGWDACPPSAALAAAAETASGPGWRCDRLSRDELVGLLRRWQALESWAAAGKLGVLRALIRAEDQPLPGGSHRAGLPEGWTKSLTHEVAAALAVSVTSAENLMWLAWDLQAQLPAIGELLAAGELTLAKARAIDQALNLLTDQDAAAAEAMIIPELPGKTYSQAAALAAQAAITVDPESAVRRREEAERSKARVLMFREESGAAGLSGRDLPTDQALAAHARVCERAAQYNDSGAFGEARMDQLRATAYLDLINGTTAQARIAAGHLATQTQPGAAGRQAQHTADTGPGSGGPSPASDQGGPGSDDPGGDDPGGDDPGGDDPGGDDPGGAGAAGPASPPRLTDLVLPLATLLGLAERPGEGHGLGPLDPALVRDLAAAATASPQTRLCVTVTNQDGIAIGHGCTRPPARQRPGNSPGSRSGQGQGNSQGTAPAGTDHTNASSTTARLALPARAQHRHREPAERPGRGNRPARHISLAIHPRRPAQATGRHRDARRHRTTGGLRALDTHPARRQTAQDKARTDAHLRLRPPPRIACLPAQ